MNESNSEIPKTDRGSKSVIKGVGKFILAVVIGTLIVPALIFFGIFLTDVVKVDTNVASNLVLFAPFLVVLVFFIIRIIKKAKRKELNLKKTLVSIYQAGVDSVKAVVSLILIIAILGLIIALIVGIYNVLTVKLLLFIILIILLAALIGL